MKIKDYPRNLELLVNQHIGKFLEADSKAILINRARSLRSNIERGGGNWRFSIPHEHPLTLKKNDYKLQIDILCELEGIEEKITKQNITLRIWCLDETISYRASLDHPNLKEKLERNNWKRVILRFHFDLKEPNGKQLEPLYHFHVGGRYRTSDEYCWLPEQIEIPRFPYPPMDLILLCEFLLINFFPKQSEKLRKKPEWKNLVRKSQELFLEPYFTRCMKHLNNSSETLLGNLVTPPKEV